MPGLRCGTVVIWDFETRSVAREFTDDRDGEGVAVLSVSWSSNG